jgi:hypothetical protein
MKTYKIEIFNIKWDADFCGELPANEVSRIISSQPSTLTISFKANKSDLENCADAIVDEVVESYVCDSGSPCWISNFDYRFI